MTFSVRIFLVTVNSEFVHGHNPNGRCLFAARPQMSKNMFFVIVCSAESPMCNANQIQ